MAENLIPIAVSSELDVTGEERIHMANRAIVTRATYVQPAYVAISTLSPTLNGVYRIASGQFSAPVASTMPQPSYSVAASQTDPFIVHGTFNDTTNMRGYIRNSTGLTLVPDMFDVIPGITTGINGCSFTLDGEYFAAAGTTSGVVTMFIYKRNGDSYERIVGQPSVLPSSISATNGNSYKVAWSPDSNYLVVHRRTKPTAADSTFVYKRVGDVFTLLTTAALQIDSAYAHEAMYSPLGDHLVQGGTRWPASGGTSQYLKCYTQTGDTFALNSALGVYTDVSTAGGFTFSNSGEYFALALSSGSVVILKRSGGTYSLVHTIASLFGAYLAFTPDDQYLVISDQLTNNIRLYARSGDTFTLADTENVGQSSVRVVTQ